MNNHPQRQAIEACLLPPIGTIIIPPRARFFTQDGRPLYLIGISCSRNQPSGENRDGDVAVLSPETSEYSLGKPQTVSAVVLLRPETKEEQQWRNQRPDNTTVKRMVIERLQIVGSRGNNEVTVKSTRTTAWYPLLVS